MEAKSAGVCAFSKKDQMILVLTGTRPELIKVAPIIHELQKQNVPFIFVHSGQHYSYEMDGLIISDLQLPIPDFHLNVGSASHAVQTGKIMEGVEKLCLEYKPKLVLVHGDTNTTLAGALAAKKLHIDVGHIEAGLRSFDYAMPEEINRILVDRISDVLFAPTATAKKNLKREGIFGKKVVVTGNTVVDAVLQHVHLAKKSNILDTLSISSGEYILVTAHRAENVDEKQKLEALVDLLAHAQKKVGKMLLWPMHPRTQQAIQKWKIELPKKCTVCSPVGYIDMLALLSHAELILTDSGGVQEEAYVLRKKLMTLRDSTERPETLSANFIIHADTRLFDEAWQKYQDGDVEWMNTFGDGTASKKIVKVVRSYL